MFFGGTQCTITCHLAVRISHSEVIYLIPFLLHISKNFTKKSSSGSLFHVVQKKHLKIPNKIHLMTAKNISVDELQPNNGAIFF